MDAKRRAEVFLGSNTDLRTAGLRPPIELRIQALIEAAEQDAVATERKRIAAELRAQAQGMLPMDAAEALVWAADRVLG